MDARTGRIVGISLGLLALVLLAATCAPTATPTAQVVRETVVVKQTVAVQVTKVVEATPVPTPKPVTITVMQSEAGISNLRQYNDFTGKRFERENNVHIEYALLPDDPYGKISAMLAAKDPSVTLIRVQYWELPRYAAAGWCVPLDGKLPISYTNDLIQWDAYAWDGKHYAVNWVNDVTMLMWRKDLFREAGLNPDKPPQTWDELYQYAKKLTKKDANGNTIVAGFGMWEETASWEVKVWDEGGRMLNEQGQPTFNSPEGVKAFQYFLNMYKEGILMPETPFYNIHSGFLDGKVAMVHQYSYFWGPAAGQFGVDNVGIGPLPRDKDGKVRNILSGHAYFINAFASPEQQEAALKWLLFFNTPEYMGYQYTIGWAIGTPFNSQVSNATNRVQYADWQVTYQDMTQGEIILDPPALYKPAINRAFQDMVAGMSVKEALDKAAASLSPDPDYAKLDALKKTGPWIK